MPDADPDEPEDSLPGDAPSPDPDRRGVHETYDRIADHFARTRAHPWPEVREFCETADRCGTALDLACGNGRHAELLAAPAERVVGLDASRKLLRVAHERAVERGYADSLSLVAGDAARLPLAADSVELGVYVAALHHLPTRETRRASLDDLARVLAPGGRVLVSVWAVTHSKFDRESGFDTTVDWTLPGGETVGRFYHVYDLAEFEADLRASTLTLETVYESEGNCYAVVGGA
ncbi:class I SAM-dependent methyltransferase [Halomarina oriensis]|uniref:Methyltransferase domain-containing protein n=1 Tax=Halomarina oriensis TaxID=671145 RepID=A0A6B0GY46_9EURY|nr:class I SAM-dependent methyltransferase [Halomarina oriensis]MWG36708.1 methyltransferase domain-containing protein [Halomarina oriensis]